MNRLLYIITGLIISVSSFAQESTLKIGEWRAIIPYNVATSVTQDTDKVYVGSNIGLLMLDKFSASKDRLSRVNGLSDINIQHCIFDENSQSLILFYESLIIDILGDNGIRTNFDLKNFNFTQGVKEINSVYADGEGGILISSNFGLSRFNIAEEEFSFTARKLGLNVYNSCVFNNEIYIATNEGIYHSDKSNPNIDNVETWTFLDSDEFSPGYESYALNVFENTLYLGVDNAVFSYSENTFEKVLEDDTYTAVYINTSYGQLLVGYACPDENCTDGPLYRKTLDSPFSNIKPENANCFGENKNAIADQTGKIWLSDNFIPLRYLSSVDGIEYSCGEIYPNNIADKGAFDIELNGEEIFVAPGGYGVNYDYLSNRSGLLGYENGNWKRYNNIKNADNSFKYSNIQGLDDVSSVEVHPETNDVYFGSYLDGLVHFDRAADEMNVYNDSNSTLDNIPGDITRTRIGDLAFDDSNNLWIANYGSPNPISVWDTNSEWKEFDALGKTKLIKLVIDNNNYKWFVIAGNSDGVLVYDSGDDPFSQNDDRYRVLNTSNSNLPTNNVNSIAVDKDGDVWVGTQEGPIVFDCASNIFEQGVCQGSLRIGTTDNIGAYLLETENINCIGIDGANRKWFGTDNGIFVHSESGEQQILKLDVDNSPLFSNSIKVIKFHPSNGEVYIGTSEGIMVLRGEALDGGEFHSEVEVFPNPVRPDYDGPIAIRGVSENSRIKITTVDGKLVYELDALGGQAVWDGRDLKGREVETGVYLIFASSDENFDKPRTTVGKLMIVR